jgi:hypothetical protein
MYCLGGGHSLVCKSLSMGIHGHTCLVQLIDPSDKIIHLEQINIATLADFLPFFPNVSPLGSMSRFDRLKL